MKLIGLHGWAQTGKDTVGAFLKTDWEFERRAFADKLKEVANAIDPIIDAVSWDDKQGTVEYRRLSELIQSVGPERAKNHPEVRRLYQRVGTEAGRMVYGESHWIDVALADLPERTVITDVRFHNEAAAVRALGGRVACVTRPGIGPANSHVSEAGIKDELIDGYINNDGSLGQLRDRVHDLMVEWGWA